MPDAAVLFDRGPSRKGACFEAPCDIIQADTPNQIDGAIEAMEAAQSNGKWLAGYLSYEFGYLMSPKLEGLLPQDRELPLLQFGVFDAPPSQRPAPNKDGAQLQSPTPVWSEKEYAQAFEQVHELIKAGHIYQVNLTFPLETTFSGSVEALYTRLAERQPVPHGALVNLGGPALLSRSPELFFSLTQDGVLTTKPMKGTAPRSASTSDDDALRDGLSQSEKNQAENLMIVDLLRNDMSRISKIGSVRVPDLFTVERFATVHQMTSRITSQIVKDTPLKRIFEALFPCGSITGAPKIRAMEIIRDIEPHARNAYCGSIGWIAPDGAMEFNVAIRTLMCRSDNTAQLNVGGGLVYDSTAKDEYEEALLKSQFAVLS